MEPQIGGLVHPYLHTNGETVGNGYNGDAPNAEGIPQVEDNNLIPGIADVQGLGGEVDMNISQEFGVHHTEGNNMMNDDPFLLMLGATGRDFSYVNDMDYSIQAAIANRVDSHVPRSRENDESRGYNQVFNVETGIPVFYNEPVGVDGNNDGDTNQDSPADITGMADQGEGEAVHELQSPQNKSEDEEQAHVIPGAEEGQLINHFESSDNEDASEEWPTESWIPSNESDNDSTSINLNHGLGTPGQSKDPRTDTAGERHKVNYTVDTISDDHWEILTCKVVKQYEGQDVTISESAMDNKVVLEEDLLGRAFKMTKTKEKIYKYGIGMNGKGACKRKADSNPELELSDYGLLGLTKEKRGDCNLAKRRCISTKGKELGGTCAKVGDNFSSAKTGDLCLKEMIVAMDTEDSMNSAYSVGGGPVDKMEVEGELNEASNGVSEIDRTQSPIHP